MGAKKSGGLTAKACRKIRESILSGKHLPGETLYEMHLAERYGMSRTPVRVALQVLAREGLVDAMPGRGFLVPRRSLQDLRELYELREALEGVATACAARYATSNDVSFAESGGHWRAYKQTKFWSQPLIRGCQIRAAMYRALQSSDQRLDGDCQSVLL